MSCNTGLHNAINKILNNKPWFKYKQGDDIIEILDSPNGKINSNTSTGAAIALANVINTAVNNGYKNIGNVVEKRTNYKTNRGYVEIVATSKQLDLINAQDEKEIAELQDYVNAEIELGKIKDYNPLNVEEFNNLSDEKKSEVILKEQEEKDGNLFQKNQSSQSSAVGNVYSEEIKNKYFNSGNTQKSNVILQKIAESSHPLANLAKHLLKYTNINNVNIILDSVESFNLDDIKNSRAYYSSFDNLIKIAQFGKYKNVQQIETILLHEILHALSYKAIRENTKANEKFNELYKKSISFLGAYNLETKEGFYGNYTIDEFFVGIFTDSKFIKALSNIPSEKSGYKNLFEEIMDFILNILGIEKGTTLHTEAYAVATNILSEYQNYTDYLTEQSQMVDDYYEQQFETNIKPGVKELFDSNPELANEVYEALGFKVNKYIDKKYYENYNNLLALFNKSKNLNILNNVPFNIINAPNNIKEKYQVATTIKEKIWEDDILGEFKDFSDSVFLKIEYNEKYGTFDLFKSTKFNEFGKEYKLIEEDLSYDIIKKLLSYSNPALTYFEKQAKITLQQKQQAQQLYSQYLDTIFPDSKVKDIVYHGTKGFDSSGREKPKFDKFDKIYIGKGQGLRSDDMAKGFYFGSYKIADRVGTRIIPAILNVQEENTTTVRRNTKDFDTKGDVFVVFEPEQIHILGNKQDIEEFKKYMQFKNNIKDYFNLSEEDSNFVTDISNINFNC